MEALPSAGPSAGITVFLSPGEIGRKDQTCHRTPSEVSGGSGYREEPLEKQPNTEARRTLESAPWALVQPSSSSTTPPRIAD